MLINQSSLDLVFKGFQSVYTDAHLAVPKYADQVAMKVGSSGHDETYGWMGQFPMMREWLGPRVVNNLKASSFTIVNRSFESTIAVKRNDISDDRLGVFKPMFQQMGHLAAQHPEELVFGILRDGFLNKCHDGEFFFDVDHPTLDLAGAPATYSNMQAGAGPAWFLLDTSQGIKPLVWQEREPYTFETVDQGEDIHVFSNDEFLFGIRARVNAGYGLPQLAFGSKAALTPANYAAARAAMMGFRSDQGRILGIRPTALVVPPALESDALSLLNTEIAVGGASSNPWKGTASLIITPFVA